MSYCPYSTWCGDVSIPKKPDRVLYLLPQRRRMSVDCFGEFTRGTFPDDTMEKLYLFIPVLESCNLAREKFVEG